MSDFLAQVLRDFEHGLNDGLEGYCQRSEQISLAREIAETMTSCSVLVAEAETGTGKTLAYLVPALRSDQRIVISTHTRALQDQLVHRDLPSVQQALGIRRRVCLLKGRANYLCPARLNMHLAQGTLALWEQKSLLQVKQWSQKSRDGDLASLSFDPFSKGIGGMVTATAEQCTGSKCGDFERCPLMQARRKAQAADIVVTNHSLLLADAALKSGDYGEVLPEFEVYLLDEAHALPQLACQHFGVLLTQKRFIQWFNDMQAALDELGDETDLKTQLLSLFESLLAAYRRDDLQDVSIHWVDVLKYAETRAIRNDDLQRLFERAQQINEELAMVLRPEKGFVGWSEGENEQRRHIVAPVETGPVLQRHLWDKSAAFVLLSATLRVSGHFDYTRRRFGLEETAREAFHPSPFDYEHQALIYLPKHLSDTRSPAGMRRLADEMEALIRAAGGRAFVLFTAWETLRQVGQLLKQRLPWHVLLQGESGSRDAILETFRSDTHSVLCGTRSFWEGVDVPGESLSLVIIDRMPFAPPGDPLLQARMQHCEAEGGRPFTDIQLPEAIAALRQGIGRLIRTEHDRGVIALLDSRLYRRGYGREVVRNLPAAPITPELDDVRRFFSHHEEDALS